MRHHDTKKSAVVDDMVCVTRNQSTCVRRAGPEQETIPGSPRCLTQSGLEFLLATYVPVDSCTSSRRHGRITHQPEDAGINQLSGELRLSSGKNVRSCALAHMCTTFPDTDRLLVTEKC